VVGAEEHLGVLPIREGHETRVRPEVAAGPLPDVTDQLMHPERGGTPRIGAYGSGPKMPLPQIRVARRRILVSPRVAPGPSGGRIVPGRLLPLRLGGQSTARPRRERLGFVVGDVYHRFVVRDRFVDPEPRTPPVAVLPPPETRRVDVVNAAIVPAFLAPPTPVVVSAVLHELR